MGKRWTSNRRTVTTNTGRCQRKAAPKAESSTPTPTIRLTQRNVTSLYLSKCTEALEKLPELLKAMTIIQDMERIAANDCASIEELVSYERYGKRLAAEFPNDQQIQDQKLMEEIDLIASEVNSFISLGDIDLVEERVAHVHDIEKKLKKALKKGKEASRTNELRNFEAMDLSDSDKSSDNSVSSSSSESS